MTPDIVKQRIISFATMAWSFLRHMGSRYSRDGCRESAAALTYMSLFAVVPLMTLMYSMFSLIPAFQGLGDQVQTLIFDNFLPQSGSEVQQYLQEFSNQARKLSLVGVIILVVTAYLMLANIEKTFNHIWGTLGGRKGLTGFLLYWSILSFGPLLVGIGLAMHTYLLSFQLIVDEVTALGLAALILEYLPWLMTWAAFTLLFLAVPNCRVIFRYAVVGGLVTMLFFELAKDVFGNLVANTSFHSVYGAFAMVPVFLMWIYLCWMIILGGAELVRSLETFKSVYRGHRYPDLTAVVLICWKCWRRQQKGTAITDRDMLQSGIDNQHWQRLRALLLERKILENTTSGRYVLTRDISQLSLWELVEMFGDNFTHLPSERAGEKLGNYPWFHGLEEIVRRVGENATAEFATTLEDLFRQHQEAEGG